MIKKWILTGDTHGDVVSRLENIKLNNPEYIPEETGVIILGDAGLNYWGNKIVIHFAFRDLGSNCWSTASLL